MKKSGPRKKKLRTKIENFICGVSKKISENKQKLRRVFSDIGTILGNKQFDVDIDDSVIVDKAQKYT